MTIKEMMKIGTSEMSAEQKEAEQARRLKVVERINRMAEVIERINVQLEILPADYKCCKVWKNRKKSYARELKRIKANESEWLKQAAWFMYA